AQPNGSKAGGIGDHIGESAAVGVRTEGVAQTGRVAGGSARRTGNRAGDAGRYTGDKDNRVTPGIRSEAIVGAAVGSTERGATKPLLDGVAAQRIVDPNHGPANVGVGRPCDPEVSVGVVDESHVTGQALIPFLDRD